MLLEQVKEPRFVFLSQNIHLMYNFIFARWNQRRRQNNREIILVKYCENWQQVILTKKPKSSAEACSAENGRRWDFAR